jgi:hypothetical protein
MDADEQYGQPVVTNGLPLSKIHHAAFDANLIGIEPDYRVHVSDRLLEIHDGPFLELGLKRIAGTLIDLPRRAGIVPTGIGLHVALKNSGDRDNISYIGSRDRFGDSRRTNSDRGSRNGTRVLRARQYGPRW